MKWNLQEFEVWNGIDEVNVIQLSLNGGKFDTLPAKIFKLTKLEKLRYFNLLEIFPPEIGKLAQLVTLNCACNRLACLPSEINGNLGKLTTIICNGNRLTSLPAEISCLANLLLKLYLIEL